MSQSDVIEFINNNSDIYTCEQLANEFNLTNSTMSVLVRKCFKGGFIDRKTVNVAFPKMYGYFAKV